MIALLWLAVAVVLVAVELHHVAFYAIFGALGAVVAALVALAVPSAFLLQVVAAMAAAALGIVLARPYVSRAFLRVRGESAARGVHGGFVGETVVALDTVSSVPGGHVRLVGESWLARTDADEVLVAGSSAVVIRVLGTTLTVSALPLSTEFQAPRTNLESLRENFERIIDSRTHHPGDHPARSDLRPAEDDQHRSTG